MDEGAYGVLVEEVECHSCHSAIRPVAMDQQQPLQELESGHGKVTSHHGLHKGGEDIMRTHEINIHTAVTVVVYHSLMTN